VGVVVAPTGGERRHPEGRLDIVAHRGRWESAWRPGRRASPEGVSLDFGPERFLLGSGASGRSLRLGGFAARCTRRQLRQPIHGPRRTGARISDEAPRLLRRPRSSRVTEEGRIRFALAGAPNSLLSGRGWRRADVLVRVNDVPIDSLATLMGLYPRCRTRACRAVVLRTPASPSPCTCR